MPWAVAAAGGPVFRLFTTRRQKLGRESGEAATADGYAKFFISAIALLVAAPLIGWTARIHRVTRRRTRIRGMVTGALPVAGFFTFPFGRMPVARLFG